jgi:hypothetical protein
LKKIFIVLQLRKYKSTGLLITVICPCFDEMYLAGQAEKNKELKQYQKPFLGNPIVDTTGALPRGCSTQGRDTT